jgi:PPOX class probable F420-dependent enzyme
MLAIPEDFRDLLTTGKKAFAVLATASVEGSPLSAPVWFMHDEDFILISTDRNSAKGRNMLVNPNISIVIMAENNHLRYIHIKGEVEEITRENYEEFSRELWYKYTGRAPDANNQSESSFIFKIRPKKISTFDYT